VPPAVAFCRRCIFSAFLGVLRVSAVNRFSPCFLRVLRDSVVSPTPARTPPSTCPLTSRLGTAGGRLSPPVHFSARNPVRTPPYTHARSPHVLVPPAVAFCRRCFSPCSSPSNSTVYTGPSWYRRRSPF